MPEDSKPTETKSTRIPGHGVDPEGMDVASPVVATLAALNLLPTTDDLGKSGGAKAILFGPPDSVVVIEAGATALSKWWAAGLGVAATGVWAGVSRWWTDLKAVELQSTALWAAAIVSAAAVVAIGYIVASDVRGRAAASVATINAREAVAVAYINASLEANGSAEPEAPDLVVALPGALSVRNTTESGNSEDGWLAIALRQHSGTEQFLVVKHATSIWIDASKIEFLQP